MNRYSKKKRVIFALVYIVCVCLIIVLLGMLQYRRISYNYNLHINAVCDTIRQEYPDVDVNRIIRLMSSNSSDLTGYDDVLSEYGIESLTSSAIAENNKLFAMYLAIDLAVAILISIVIFVIVNRIFVYWDKKLEAITTDLAKINSGDYSYDMNTGEEGKLSILESEIYKTAITCREAAENSREDKEKLKESLSDISHQLKTPITSLLINLENLEEYPDLPEEKRMLIVGNAKRDTNKINQMVQMLLKLSRLDADAIEFVQKDVPVDHIINKSIENVLALCDLKGVDISYTNTETGEEKHGESVIVGEEKHGENTVIGDEKHGQRTIFCDEYWEIEAVSNILKNGIEHAESTVRISFTEYEMYSEIQIENDGDPISKEEAGKIFTRYYRGETSVIDSVGIGLSLADSIVRRDNGYIIAESYEKDNENGTRFTIRYMR